MSSNPGSANPPHAAQAAHAAHAAHDVAAEVRTYLTIFWASSRFSPWASPT